MKRAIGLFLVTVFIIFNSVESFSQCSMCRQTAESSQANDNTGRGLNKGILYLLAIPYVLGGIGAVVWYKNRKKV